MTQHLRILYQDDWLVAVDKPCGMMVHRSRLSEDDTFVLQTLRDQIGRRVYPAHRLDRPTSGVLLFTLDPDTARALGATFTARQVVKRYLAVVRGYTAEHGVIDYPLSGESADGALQAAVSRYRRLAITELPVSVDRYPTSRYSLVEVEPETGRMHQIRRHFAHISHPLIGDTTHGQGRHNRLFRERFDSHRLLLHAWRMELAHPVTGKPLDIVAPPDDGFSRVLQALGWQLDALGIA